MQWQLVLASFLVFPRYGDGTYISPAQHAVLTHLELRLDFVVIGDVLKGTL